MKQIILYFLSGAAIYFIGYGSGFNSASYQGHNGKYWNAMFEVTGDNLHNANQQLTKLNAENAALSDQITALKAAPTPTPEIVYKTNTVTQTQYVPEVQYVQAARTQLHCTDNGFTGLLHQMNCN